jgi:hypothetical protein
LRRVSRGEALSRDVSDIVTRALAEGTA